MIKTDTEKDAKRILGLSSSASVAGFLKNETRSWRDAGGNISDCGTRLAKSGLGKPTPKPAATS